MKRIISDLRKLSTLQATGTSSTATTNGFTTCKLPDLPYDFGALEPCISGQIMQLHHQRHHATYVKQLNLSLEQLYDAQHSAGTADLQTILQLQQSISFNGGGHLNHSLFWQNLVPPSQFEQPKGTLLTALLKQWPNPSEQSNNSAASPINDSPISAFQQKFQQVALGVQGSGWAWLGYNTRQRRLEIATTPNQEYLLSAKGLIPLLAVDVWEHAYYLQYLNARGDYMQQLWRCINWEQVTERYIQAQQQ